MTKDKTIYIQNIYYMLSYALQALRQQHYQRVQSEIFDGVEDLFAEILYLGTSQQLKQGLYREYVSKQEDMPGLRGKLDLHRTIRNQIQHKKVLSCTYDDLSVNNLQNQILRTTVGLLIGSPAVNKERKVHLRSVLPFLAEVDVINPTTIRWDTLWYQRNNWTYEMLINVCWLAIKGMLQTTEDGQYRLANFSDDHMEKVFEKFVLEYYKRHHGDRIKARSAEVKWNYTCIPEAITDAEQSMIQFLPKMQTDVLLENRDTALIIDTKYYGKMMQQNGGGSEKFHSANMYQIYSYVKNYDRDKVKTVSGLLLYARTNEEIVPNGSIMMDGNRIGVRTLDLNQPFDMIKLQLDRIVEDFLGNCASAH